MGIPFATAAFWTVAGAGLVWIFGGVLLYGWRRKSPPLILAVAGISSLCGLGNALLGSAHLAVVLARAAAGRGFAGSETFAYGFHFYSLVLVGVLLVLPGCLCLYHARGVVRLEPAARSGALRSSLVLLAVNLPMMPFQPFAILLSVLAGASAAALALTRG